MSQREPRGGQQLTSWKEIASYLERSVRTVRRWEATEGLPVHRHRHQKGATVFALRAEVDAWQSQRRAMAAAPAPDGSRDPKLASEPPPAPTPEPRPAPVASSPRRWIPVAAGVALAILGLVGGWRLRDMAPVTPTAGPAESDRARLLVAAVDNRTEQTGLDGAFERALEREIVDSERLGLVPARRVDETLRLMRRTGETVGTPLALELAERDAAIDAIVSGRLEPTVTGTLLSVDVLDAGGSGRILSLSEPVARPERLLPEIDRLAARTARGLVEAAGTLRAERPQPPRVTTRSRAAFQLYVQGDELLAQNQPEAAAQLYRLALHEDEDFAAARIQLAWAERETGVPEQQYLASAERALSAADDISSTESHFVRGSFAHLAGDSRQAWSAYGALLSADADHYWGNRRALDLCRPTRTRTECLPLQVRLADLRPEDPRANYLAARELVFQAADLDAAARYAERARQQLGDEIAYGDGEMAVWLMLFEARRSWARGDISAVVQQAAELDAGLASWPPAVRDLMSRELGIMALALGRLDDAEGWFRRITDPATHHEMLAWHLFASGKKDELKRHLSAEATYREPFTAVLLAMVGEQQRAERLIASLEQAGLQEAYASLARGASAFFAGRHDEAIALLETTLSGLEPTGHSVFFAGSDILAMARWQRGDLLRAIQALEMTSRQRRRAIFSDAGLHWIKCQSRLAGLYLEAGRDADLRATDDEISKRLEIADPTFPELSGLSQRRATAHG